MMVPLWAHRIGARYALVHVNFPTEWQIVDGMMVTLEQVTLFSK